MTTQLAESVEHWPVDRLLPYAANARTHDEEQVTGLAASIAEFGFNVPVLVDDQGVLIAGHGRLLAAKRLGLPNVPVIRLGHLTDAQARAYRLADNRIAENAGWDEELLAGELAQLQQDGVDLSVLGFSAEEIGELLDSVAEPAVGSADEDEVPEPPVEPVTRMGDLWLLGPHRLLCGDATVADDVARLLDGATAAFDGDRPAVRRRVRPDLACRGRGVDVGANRQGLERRPCRLAGGLGAVSRARSPMSGMPGFTPVSSPRASSPPDSRSGPRSFGSSRAWF